MLESCQAISDFMQAIFDMENFKDFDKETKKENETICNKRRELQMNKQYYANEERTQMVETLHQIDTCFFLSNLYHVYYGLRPENITEYGSEILFYRTKPDDPMPEYEKKEYLDYMEKVYKRALPFLRSAEQEETKIKFKSYDEKAKILIIGNYKIPIAKHEGNNNAHEIMTYIFIDNKNSLRDKFYYAEMAEKRFGATYNSSDKYAHQPYSGACDRINDIIFKETNGQVKGFLTFNHSKLGYLQVNPKYL